MGINSELIPIVVFGDSREKRRENLSVNNLPPQHIEAEEAILGGILLDPAAIGEVRAILRQEHFYIPAHCQIYRAAESLDEAGKPTDLMSVTSWLYDNEVLDNIGGQGKLADLVGQTVSAVNIARYSQLVLEKYERRMLIRAGHELIENCYDGRKKLEETRDKLEEELSSIGVGGVQGEFPVAYNYATREGFLDPKQGIKSGFYELDSLVGGFQKAEYIIIAGRPSIGKTAWALQAARHIAGSLPCVFFSLEMTGQQLTTRLVCGDVGIPSDKIRKGHITNDERKSLEKAIEGYKQIPLVISDVPMGISQMLSYSNSVRRLKGGLGAVCIDYLQLLKYDGDNPTVGVSKLSAQLKAMAKKLDVPLIVLSQLSRSVESRNNKRPINSDLRDSGSLEQDADLIIMCYRDEYYNKDTEEPNTAELIITKHRTGPTGTVKLEFKRGQFYNPGESEW